MARGSVSTNNEILTYTKDEIDFLMKGRCKPLEQK